MTVVTKPLDMGILLLSVICSGFDGIGSLTTITIRMETATALSAPPKRLSPIPGLLLLLLTLVIACFIYKDYGVSWDETSQHHIGMVNMNFIRHMDYDLIAGFWDKDHGASFEILLIWIENLFGVSHPKDVTPLRHLCTFIFFLLGIFCGYLLMLRLYRQQWLALQGLLMLLLQPRIFAHAFFNTKDIPFLTAFVIALYAIYVALEGQRRHQWILAGASCGFAAGIRLLGGVLGVLSLAVLLARYLSDKEQRKAIRSNAAFFVLASALSLYITWPTLWFHPIDDFTNALKSLSQFTRFNSNVLFRGQSIFCGDLPWYYAPFWIGISTPLLWLALPIAGIGIFVAYLLRRSQKTLPAVHAQMLLICLGSVLLPLLAIVLLHSVVYDDWRHLYFIYPPFIIAGLYAFRQLDTKRPLKLALIAITLVQAGFTTGYLVQAHPFQQVYFNALVPESPEYVRQRYDLEYWCVSYKQAFEYLLQYDSSQSIPVLKQHSPLLDNVQALPDSLSRRIRWANEEKGTYIITNYRGHPEDYPYRKIWGIKREGSTIVQLYKID